MATSLISYTGLKTCRYLLKFSYIGTRYKGLQRQTLRNQKYTNIEEDGTIQCAIEDALNRALLPVFGARLALSSRTDRGVHAYHNYANVDLTHPLKDTIYKTSFITDAVNRLLKMGDHEISLIETRLVTKNFHSRINAKWREYVYKIAISPYKINVIDDVDHLRPCLPVSLLNRCILVNPIDLDVVKHCIEMLNGKHDFSSFSTKNKSRDDQSTIKDMKLHLTKTYPLADFELNNNIYSQLEFFNLHLKSSSFLYNQVRRMVSAIIDVGLGKLSLNDIEKMLNIPYYRPHSISNMVPSCGLFLVDVGYDEDGEYTTEIVPCLDFKGCFDDVLNKNK